jgi:hypothetical protein
MHFVLCNSAKTGDNRLAFSNTELSQDVLVADWLPSGPMLCVPDV